MAGESADRWFVCHARRPDAEVRLFCLPYAGAGASAYRGWPAAFGPRVEVVAVQLPGRENRIREPLELDPAAIAAAIASVADRPFAIFGHSLGGRLGFEVIKELRRSGRPQPQRFYPSASRAPDQTFDGPLDGLSRLDDVALLDRLGGAGGFPAQVLAEPELMALILPVLRFDLAWTDAYRYRPEPPLAMPLTAFAGELDRGVPPEHVEGWQRQSAAGGAMHVLPGGHFFLHEHLAQVAGVIESDLLGGPAD
jgi:surfactin synthase thioesterase subunit